MYPYMILSDETEMVHSLLIEENSNAHLISMYFTTYYNRPYFIRLLIESVITLKFFICL